MIWQKVLGVPAQNYFYDEGTWGNDGISFSLIQASNTVDYVKPSALATMTTSRLLAGRPYLAMPATGIPQGYRADFGTTAGGATKESAVWTDGVSETASVTLTSPTGSTDPVTVTSEYGTATTTQATSGTAYGLPRLGPGQLHHLSGRGHPLGRPHRDVRHRPGLLRGPRHGLGLERERQRRHRRPDHGLRAGMVLGHG